MLWSLLLYLLLPIVTILLVREALVLIRTLNYKKQGFLWKYYPFLGNIKLFGEQGTGAQDVLADFKNVLTTAKHLPGVVANDSIGGSAVIYLTSLELAKEFFIKEVSVSKRALVGDLKVNFSFFFDNSEHGMTHRSVFAELFKLENIVANIPMIQQVAKSQFSNLIEGQSAQFDFKPKFEEVIKEMGRKIIFGDKAEVPCCPDEEKTLVTEMIFKIILEVGTKGLNNPFNILLGDLPNKHNWLAASKLGAERAKMVSRIITETYNIRKDDPKYQLGVNILDLMIKNNRTNPSHQFSPQDIVGDFSLFLFAASDTSSKTLANVTYFLGKYPEYITKIREEVERFNLNRPGVTFEDLDKSITLDAFIKEVLRLHSPVPLSFERIILKNFKLGSYDIKSGDKIVIPFSFFDSEKGHFPATDSFNPENFLPEAAKKIPQIVHIPFGAGRRNCLGRFLAEAIIKVTVIELVSNFDIFVPKDDQNSWNMSFVVEMEHCRVQLKKRTST
jgi:cytochrome P450